MVPLSSTVALRSCAKALALWPSVLLAVLAETVKVSLAAGVPVSDIWMPLNEYVAPCV